MRADSCKLDFARLTPNPNGFDSNRHVISQVHFFSERYPARELYEALIY
jgi:hypothetical protein